MSAAPLLAVVLAALAAAQPKTSPAPTPQRTDPGALAPENREVFNRYAQWRDAKGGLAEGLAAARKSDPAGVAAAFKQLKGVLTKDEYAVLESHYYLAARGVDAPMPASGRPEGPAAAAHHAPSPSPSPSPSPVGASAAAFKAGPSSLSTTAPPTAAPAPAAPAEEKPWWKETADRYLCVLYPSLCR